MAEEVKQETAKATEFNLVEQAKQERVKLEAIRTDIDKQLAELRELRASEILSGKTDAGQTSEKEKEENPKDYAERMLKGL